MAQRTRCFLADLLEHNRTKASLGHPARSVAAATLGVLSCTRQPLCLTTLRRPFAGPVRIGLAERRPADANGATADSLVCRISHNEPALLRTSINKSRLVMRRWLRDMSCGHRVNLPSRECLKRQRVRRLRDARTSGVISRPVAVFQSSVRSRLD